MQQTFSSVKRPLLWMFALAPLLGFWSCKSFEGAQVQVRPNPLEVHADSVSFKVKATIPPKSGIKKGGTYQGQLVVEGEEDSYQFTRISVPYERFPDIKDNGASITVEPTQAYEAGMNGGTLIARNQYERKGKTLELPNTELAECCITTSQLVCEDYQLVLSDHEYESKVPVTLEAKFQFPQDVWEIQPTEYEKSEIKAIGEFLKKDYNAKQVTIEGFASPEGAFRRNEYLSIARMKQVRNWLIEQLKENGYDAYMDSSFFKVSTTTEDWEGFKASLDRTTYSEDVKRQIIEIISSGLPPAKVEDKVMALVGGMDEVEFILAPLRRATIRMEGTSSGHSDDEIQEMVSAFVAGRKDYSDVEDFFDKEELLYAVKMSEEMETKKKLLQEFARIYPEDYRGYNNLGAISMKQGYTDDALEYLTIADKKSENNPAVLNNLGVVHLNKGNHGEALANLQDAYAAKSMKETAFNIGVIYEKTANYSMGTDMFAKAEDLSCSDYNNALCKLLTGDLSGAKAAAENAIRADKERALNYYLLAVIGARSADVQLMSLNLKRAIRIDASLAEKARNDLEFRRYWDNSEFKVATKG